MESRELCEEIYLKSSATVDQEGESARSSEAWRRWISINTELCLYPLNLGTIMPWCLIHSCESRGGCGKAERVEVAFEK